MPCDPKRTTPFYQKILGIDYFLFFNFFALNMKTYIKAMQNTYFHFGKAMTSQVTNSSLKVVSIERQKPNTEDSKCYHQLLFFVQQMDSGLLSISKKLGKR